MDAEPHDLTSWRDDEQGFAAELARGRRAELQVATRLLPLGLYVRVGKLQFRTSVDERGDLFDDERDVDVEGFHLLEVKSRALEFTGPDDYPYSTALVGATRRWAARTVIPCCVVIVSEPTGQMICAPTRWMNQWLTESHHDTRRQFVETSLAAPRRLLRSWETLVTHLERGQCR